MAIVLNGSTGISTPNIDNGGTVTASGITLDNNNPNITSADSNGYLAISGDSNVDTGANIRLFGAAHATKAGDFSVRDDTTTTLKYDSSATKWNFQANDVTTTGTVTANSYTEAVFAVTGTTPALDPANGSIQTWTLSAASTPTSNLSSGESMTLMIEDGTAYSITWPTMTWVNNGGVAPTLATSGKTVVALWNVAGNLYGSFVGNGS